MTVEQTSRGAVSFVAVSADPSVGATVPSMVTLQDGVTVRPQMDNSGNVFLVVRSADVAALARTGLVVTGSSTKAAFQAGVTGGTGAGTAT